MFKQDHEITERVDEVCGVAGHRARLRWLRSQPASRALAVLTAISSSPSTLVTETRTYRDSAERLMRRSSKKSSLPLLQRRSEIGIRMALGANVQQVMRMVLLQSVRLAVLGIAVGLIGAFAVSRLMQSVLFGVHAADPLVLAVVVVLLFVTTIVASVIPSRRAARVDPSEAMRAG